MAFRTMVTIDDLVALCIEVRPSCDPRRPTQPSEYRRLCSNVKLALTAALIFAVCVVDLIAEPVGVMTGPIPNAVDSFNAEAMTAARAFLQDSSQPMEYYSFRYFPELRNRWNTANKSTGAIFPICKDASFQVQLSRTALYQSSYRIPPPFGLIDGGGRVANWEDFAGAGLLVHRGKAFVGAYVGNHRLGSLEERTYSFAFGVDENRLVKRVSGYGYADYVFDDWADSPYSNNVNHGFSTCVRFNDLLIHDCSFNAIGAFFADGSFFPGVRTMSYGAHVGTKQAILGGGYHRYDRSRFHGSGASFGYKDTPFIFSRIGLRRLQVLFSVDRYQHPIVSVSLPEPILRAGTLNIALEQRSPIDNDESLFIRFSYSAHPYRREPDSAWFERQWAQKGRIYQDEVW